MRICNLKSLSYKKLAHLSRKKKVSVFLMALMLLICFCSYRFYMCVQVMNNAEELYNNSNIVYYDKEDDLKIYHCSDDDIVLLQYHENNELKVAQIGVIVRGFHTRYFTKLFIHENSWLCGSVSFSKDGEKLYLRLEEESNGVKLPFKSETVFERVKS